MLDKISEWLAQLAGKTSVGNALTPTIKLTVISVIAFAYITGSGAQMHWMQDALLLSPLVLSLIQIIFFTLTNPERLQSEWFFIRQRELLMQDRKGSSAPADESLYESKE